jgi:C-terminal processing protease CtpA/Prc
MSVDIKNADYLANRPQEELKSDGVDMAHPSSTVTGTSIESKNDLLKPKNKARRPSQPQDEVLTLEFKKCFVNFGIVLDNKDSIEQSLRSKVMLGNAQISKILPNSPASMDNRLKIGDRMLEINGRDLTKASLERSR